MILFSTHSLDRLNHHNRVPTLIEYVSTIMKLQEGDVILTGTPAGVGRVLPGETVTCELASKGKIVSQLRFPVVNRPNKA
jgi:acylpyruvate hydrolase